MIHKFFHSEYPDGKTQGTPNANKLIAVALLAVPSFFPALAVFCQFFAPSLAAYFLIGEKFNRSFWLLFLVFVLGSVIGIIFSAPGISIVLGQFVVIAGVILMAREQNISGPTCLISLTIALIGMQISLITILGAGNLHSMYDSFEKSMLSEFDKAVEAYAASYGKELPLQVKEVLNQFRQALQTYLPGLLCSYFFFIALLNILIFEKLTKLKKISGLAPSFDQWKMPEYLVWLFIIFGFMALLPQTKYSLIGKNGVFVVCLFYLVQGFSIIKYFFKIYETPLWARGIIYLLIGIQWYGLLLVVLVGLMDNWFGFRNRLKKDVKSS